MRKTLVVLLSSAVTAGLALFLIGFYSSCGSTGGGGTSVAQLASQFVSLSCGPGGSRCLSLSAPGSVPADGVTFSGFTAHLRDGSGTPIDNVKICFSFEDPGVALITEPTDNCGLTAPDGHVSGQFRDGTQPGSFTLIADAPPGFSLQARAQISFVPVFPAPGQNGNAGAPCQTNGDCQANLFCTFNDHCFPGPTICQQQQGVGACCTSGIECKKGTCDATTDQCLGQQTGSGRVGDRCNIDQDCDASMFCSFTDICFPGAQPTCQLMQPDGGCCTADKECASSPCNTASNRCGKASAGQRCNSSVDCNSGLFCSSNDTCFPGPQTCRPLQNNGAGSCCTDSTECVTGTCNVASGRCGLGNQGDKCNIDADCNGSAGLFCTFNDGCFPPAQTFTCQPKHVSGGCCTTDGECVNADCNQAAKVCGKVPVGGSCSLSNQCTAGACCCSPPGGNTGTCKSQTGCTAPPNPGGNICL